MKVRRLGLDIYDWRSIQSRMDWAERSLRDVVKIRQVCLFVAKVYCVVEKRDSFNCS